MKPHLPFVITAIILQILVFVLLIIFGKYDHRIDANFTGNKDTPELKDTLTSVYPCKSLEFI